MMRLTQKKRRLHGTDARSLPKHPSTTQYHPRRWGALIRYSELRKRLHGEGKKSTGEPPPVPHKSNQ